MATTIQKAKIGGCKESYRFLNRETGEGEEIVCELAYDHTGPHAADAGGSTGGTGRSKDYDTFAVWLPRGVAALVDVEAEPGATKEVIELRPSMPLRLADALTALAAAVQPERERQALDALASKRE